MFTPQQEEYLGRLADKGLADEAEIAARNATVLADMEKKAAHDAKLAEVTAAKQAEISAEMAAFDKLLKP